MPLLPFIHHPAPSMSDEPALDWLTLFSFPGVGCTMLNRLVRHFGTPGRVLAASPARLLEVEGVGGNLARMISDSIRAQSCREKAAQELEKAAGAGCAVICPDDGDYPAHLAGIEDPPVALYCRGNADFLRKPAVAMVGSRAASSYGRRVSFELARELARNGVCVVSGMAAGIDGEAHAGALAGGGPTIGVLGCGVDVVYPQQHARLFKEVEDNGLLVSEYPLGTPPDSFRFPDRNRIISGIALGTVVVEASLRSGSLITARLALDQGRDVFAVPGRIDSAKSRGTHKLIQQGAKLVGCVDDILEELDMAGLLDQGHVRGESGVEPLELPDEERQLLSCLDTYPITIDELVLQSGHDAARVFQILLALELKGVVRQLPGQQYELSA